MHPPITVATTTMCTVHTHMKLLASFFVGKFPFFEIVCSFRFLFFLNRAHCCKLLLWEIRVGYTTCRVHWRDGGHGSHPPARRARNPWLAEVVPHSSFILPQSSMQGEPEEEELQPSAASKARQTSLAPGRVVDPMKNTRYAKQLVHSPQLSISRWTCRGRRAVAIHHQVCPKA